MSHWRGPLCAVGHHGVDHLVADVFEETRLPVVLEPRWIKGVEQLLGCGVGDGADLVHQRWAEYPEGFQESFSLRERPSVADADTRDSGAVRQGNKDETRGHLVGGRPGEVAEELEDLLCLFKRISDYTPQNLADGVELILERGHDTKVPTAAPQGPE